MPDIVERLEIAAQHDTPHDTLMSEAADEIERLRAALEKAANDLNRCGAYTKALQARVALEGDE